MIVSTYIVAHKQKIARFDNELIANVDMMMMLLVISISIIVFDNFGSHHVFAVYIKVLVVEIWFRGRME